MTVGASTAQCTAEGPQGPEGRVEWRLRRNCSMAPRRALQVYAVLSAVCLGIATLCWWQGATLVMAFAWLEVAALGAALLVYARHAADSECIRLERGMLSVQREWGGRVEHVEFRLDGVRIDPGHDGRSLIELSGQGRSVSVGRLVRPEMRRQLVDDLRREMRRVCQGPQTAVWVGSRTDDVTRR